jgi:hypothetical protein
MKPHGSNIQRIVVTAVLKPGSHDAAAELLRAGPPYDPEGVGLLRHGVYLGGSEAIFVFEGEDVENRPRSAERPGRVGVVRRLGPRTGWNTFGCPRGVLLGSPVAGERPSLSHRLRRREYGRGCACASDGSRKSQPRSDARRHPAFYLRKH